MNLDLLSYREHLRIRSEAGIRFLFGLVRKRWFVLTPEESVRQLFLYYLTQTLHYPISRLAVEKLVVVNTLRRRTDILVYDRQSKPWLLVECKRPEIQLDDAVFRQIAWYNLPLRVPYLVVTNGQQTYVCAMNYETRDFRFLEELPTYD